MMATGGVRSLQHRCFKVARIHFNTLGSAAFLDLPAPILRDLLPHLTVCQLEKLQPGLKQRGISTHSAWVHIHQLIYGRGHVVERLTEEEIKSEIMDLFFILAFFGFSRTKPVNNIIVEDGPSLLWMAAKYMRHFRLLTARPLKLNSLTSEDKPLLCLLEKNITKISIGNNFDLSDDKNKILLYVLHRLLDHGVATKLRLHFPFWLSWLLHRRGSQYVDPHLELQSHSRTLNHTCQATGESRGCPGDSTDASPAIPPKRLRLDCNAVEEEESTKATTLLAPVDLCESFTGCDTSTHGTYGRIECLEMEQCDSKALDVLVCALPTFFSLRSLTLHSLTIFQSSHVLGLARALKQLSESSHCSLTDLRISTLPDNLLLERLLDSSPALNSLHVEIQSLFGQLHIRPQHSVSDLELNDCRLLEQCRNKEESLQELVEALKALPSLQFLSLTHNRIDICGSLTSRPDTTRAEVVVRLLL